MAVSVGGGEGNGVDMASVYGAVLAISSELKAVRAEVAGSFADVRREFADVRREIASLREDVVAYHGSVVGHGVLISELDERVSRLERGETPPRAA